MKYDEMDPDYDSDQQEETCSIREFGKDIPEIFIENIKNTCGVSPIHVEQLGTLAYLVCSMSSLHPRCYVSKSGVTYNAPLPPICEDYHTEGTVENALLIFEKQYFDLICLLYTGSYRPIMPVLRQMLEQAAQVLNSITNKKDFTSKDEDYGMAMTYDQFTLFLLENKKLHKKSYRNSLKAAGHPKSKLTIYRKNFQNIDDYIKHIKYGKTNGSRALDLIFENLSTWVHANLWQEINNRGAHMHEYDKTHFYISRPNREEYHHFLEYIIIVCEMIICMFLAASYVDVGHYNIERAKKYFENIKSVIHGRNAPKLTMVRNLLDDPPLVQNGRLCDGISITCDCGTEVIDDFKCPSCNDILFIDCGSCNMPHIIGSRCSCEMESY